ncbi:MAG: transcription elongation factor GreA [Pseudomonadales bacterium]|nr:transcription elongation factor GreA [Pseudomonadales bacterium]
MNRVPMTVHGEQALRDELHHLKMVERPRITEAIAEARAHGDLKENAEYHAAREQQGFAEGRLQEIEAKLSNVQVIDVTKITNNGRIIFGSTVSVFDVGSEEDKIYKIVGDDESDIKANKISVNSPIARSLIGKETGDVVIVQAPGGDIELEIEKVEYI